MMVASSEFDRSGLYASRGTRQHDILQTAHLCRSSDLLHKVTNILTGHPAALNETSSLVLILNFFGTNDPEDEASIKLQPDEMHWKIERYILALILVETHVRSVVFLGDSPAALLLVSCTSAG
jgi:hypothetical protein